MQELRILDREIFVFFMSALWRFIPKDTLAGHGGNAQINNYFNTSLNSFCNLGF